MTRYFFDLHDGVPSPDHTGTNLANLEEARVQAARLLARSLDDAPQKFWQSTRELRVTARDQTGDLFTIVAKVLQGPA